MAIEWKQSTYYQNLQQFDAKIGHLNARVQDNGENWWNWWVASYELGPCAEGDVDEGGASTEYEAKRKVRAAIKKLIERMERDL